GITLPKTISDIKYKGKKSYDQKGLGYSVAYSNARCTISLFVYDLEEKNIPDGKAGDLVAGQVKASIKDVKTLEKRGTYKNVEILKDDLPLPKSVKSKFATAGLTFELDGGQCKSYVLIVGQSNHFLKVRVTQYVVDGKTNDQEVNAFLKALAKHVK